MGASASIHDLVVATLSRLGRPAPADIVQTLLMKDRCFVGHKFWHEGGYAILPAGGNSLEFYDDQGTLLETVVIDVDQGAAA